MSNDKKTIFLKPKYQLGDRVYQQMWGLELYKGDNTHPEKMIILSIVYTCDRKDGYADYSSAIKGTEVIKYTTNYSDSIVDENKLFSSVAEWDLATKDAREAQDEAVRLKNHTEKLDKYKAAKLLVAEFESKVMTGEI